MADPQSSAPPGPPALTLAESLAMAVLKGDLVAAFALADLLHENPGREKLMEAARANREGPRGLPVGRDVYQWPEFRALCRRLGILWDQLTTELTIVLPTNAPVQVTQKHVACDTQYSPGASEHT